MYIVHIQYAYSYAYRVYMSNMYQNSEHRETDICHRRVTVKDTPQKFTNSVMLPEVKISCNLRDFLFSIRP